MTECTCLGLADRMRATFEGVVPEPCPVHDQPSTPPAPLALNDDAGLRAVISRALNEGA